MLGAWLNLEIFGRWYAATLRAQHPNTVICGTFGLSYLFFGFLAGAFVTGMLLFGTMVVAESRRARRLQGVDTRAWLLER